ncbi:MAG: restriction endonuclease subunit S, partial [Methyloceanibacter sp.]
ATTGKTAFNLTGTPLLLNQRVGRIEVFSVSAHFIRFFFETIVARNLSISFGTAIPNLSVQQINETVAALPPLAEQHRIVAKVDELMTLCDRLEASLTTVDETRRRLLEALLAEALAPDARPSALTHLSHSCPSIPEPITVLRHERK